MRIFSSGFGSEFRRVAFPNHDGARVAETPDTFCILVWHVIGKETRTLGRAYASAVNDILYPNRDTMKGAANFTGRDFIFGFFGLGPRTVVCDRDKSVKRRIQRINLFQMGISHLDGRDFLGRYFLAKFGNRKFTQFTGGHDILLPILPFTEAPSSRHRQH